MSVLTVWKNGTSRTVSFSGSQRLSELLQQHGIPASQPCGGRGVCGKCAVRAEGALSAPTAAEEKAGTRLSCQITLLGDAEIWLPEDSGFVETAGEAPSLGETMAGDFGAAVDIGTTTIALKLYDLKTGRLLSQAGCMNPQRSIAADVMGRIGAAIEGKLPLLRSMVTDGIRALLETACGSANISCLQVGSMVVTGNTTMLYLLTGRHPGCLAAAPFRADCLFDVSDTLFDIPVYYPACRYRYSGNHLRAGSADSCRSGIRRTEYDLNTDRFDRCWHLPCHCNAPHCISHQPFAPFDDLLRHCPSALCLYFTRLLVGRL